MQPKGKYGEICRKVSSYLTTSSKVIIPVKTGIQCFRNTSKCLDSGFRRNDGCWEFSTFDENIIFTGAK